LNSTDGKGDIFGERDDGDEGEATAPLTQQYMAIRTNADVSRETLFLINEGETSFLIDEISANAVSKGSRDIVAREVIRDCEQVVAWFSCPIFIYLFTTTSLFQCDEDVIKKILK